MAASGWLAFAGQAYPDTPDDDFVKDLTAQGVSGDRDTLIEDGHRWCDAPKAPLVTPWSASAVKQEIMGQGYTYHDTVAIILAGERAYCPDLIPPRRGT